MRKTAGSGCWSGSGSTACSHARPVTSFSAAAPANRTRRWRRIRVTAAIRFDSAKNAAMPPMSQASSSRKAVRAQRGEIVVFDLGAVQRHLEREREHRLLPGRDIGFAIIHGDLVGDVRVLRVDAQDGAVGDHAVRAVVGPGRRHHDHFALGLGEAAFLVHQRVVEREERAELGRPPREHEKDVGHEAGLLLHLEDPRADVLRHLLERRDGVTRNRRLIAHGRALTMSAARTPTAFPRRRRRNAAPSARRATSARAGPPATAGFR